MILEGSSQVGKELKLMILEAQTELVKSSCW